jgi:ribulose 1,5-bisphosphate carboxylase large subunit-like protein
MYFYFPNTRGLPLEEVAAIFGDEEEVATYQRELHVDTDTHTVIDKHAGKAVAVEMEDVTADADV